MYLHNGKLCDSTTFPIGSDDSYKKYIKKSPYFLMYQDISIREPNLTSYDVQNIFDRDVNYRGSKLSKYVQSILWNNCIIRVINKSTM